MGRWEPDARGRLAKAAMALYAEQGFEQTTVAEIAARAGLTERTFFRHFADKREVLFYGMDMARDLLTRTIAEAPASATPMEAIGAALQALAAVFQENPERVRLRDAIVSANAELRERELSKLEALTAKLSRTGRKFQTLFGELDLCVGLINETSQSADIRGVALVFEFQVSPVIDCILERARSFRGSIDPGSYNVRLFQCRDGRGKFHEGFFNLDPARVDRNRQIAGFALSLHLRQVSQIRCQAIANLLPLRVVANIRVGHCLLRLFERALSGRRLQLRHLPFCFVEKLLGLRGAALRVDQPGLQRGRGAARQKYQSKPQKMAPIPSHVW